MQKNSIKNSVLNDHETKTFLIKKIKRQYKCSYKGCERLFREKGNLKSHERIHTGEEPFKCTFENCKRTFKTQGNLRNHILTHPSNQKISCQFNNCGKEFDSLQKLKNHEKHHQQTNKFICPFVGCNRTFDFLTNLKTHSRIHTGEMPYFCKYQGCHKRFKALGHLKEHINKHKNFKPFICDICDFPFSRSSQLKMHKKNVHIGEKPFMCRYKGCLKRFVDKKTMVDHFNTHGDDDSNEINQFSNSNLNFLTDNSQTFNKFLSNLKQGRLYNNSETSISLLNTTFPQIDNLTMEELKKAKNDLERLINGNDILIKNSLELSKMLLDSTVDENFNHSIKNIIFMINLYIYPLNNREIFEEALKYINNNVMKYSNNFNNDAVRSFDSGSSEMNLFIKMIVLNFIVMNIIILS